MFVGYPSKLLRWMRDGPPGGRDRRRRSQLILPSPKVCCTDIYIRYSLGILIAHDVCICLAGVSGPRSKAELSSWDPAWSLHKMDSSVLTIAAMPRALQLM